MECRCRTLVYIPVVRGSSPGYTKNSFLVHAVAILLFLKRRNPCWFPVNYMEFVFYGKLFVVITTGNFRVVHIYAESGYLLHFRGQSELAWSSGRKHVLQCWRPRVRVPQLTSLRFFLRIHDHLHYFTAKHMNVYCHWYFRAFGRMNFHSWVYLYCLSIPTKDKVHFLWIFPYREISILLRFSL